MRRGPTPTSTRTMLEGGATSLPSISLISCLGVLGSLAVFLLISSILVLIRSESSVTPVNRLIGLDCLLRLANIPIILHTTGLFAYWGASSPLQCAIRVTLGYTVSLLPRLLSTATAAFRWLLVCHSSALLTSQQRRRLSTVLATIVTLLTASLAMGAFHYREHYWHYHRCINPGETNIKWSWRLPDLHPFVVASNFCFFGNLVITPILYWLIFRFMKHLGKDIRLSAQTLKRRRQQNIVTAKFNFCAWLFESLLLSLAFPHLVEKGWRDLLLTTYLILSSCTCPLLYFISIGANRRKVKALAKLCRQDRSEQQNLDGSLGSLGQHRNARLILQEVVERGMEGQVLGDMEVQSFDEHDFQMQDLGGQGVMEKGLQNQYQDTELQDFKN